VLRFCCSPVHLSHLNTGTCTSRSQRSPRQPSINRPIIGTAFFQCLAACFEYLVCLHRSNFQLCMQFGCNKKDIVEKIKKFGKTLSAAVPAAASSTSNFAAKVNAAAAAILFPALNARCCTFLPVGTRICAIVPVFLSLVQNQSSQSRIGCDGARMVASSERVHCA